MAGIDADFLGALARTCAQHGEAARDAELLADSWTMARSLNTVILLLTAGEQIQGADTNNLADSSTRREGPCASP